MKTYTENVNYVIHHVYCKGTETQVKIGDFCGIMVYGHKEGAFAFEIGSITYQSIGDRYPSHVTAAGNFIYDINKQSVVNLSDCNYILRISFHSKISLSELTYFRVTKDIKIIRSLNIAHLLFNHA